MFLHLQMGYEALVPQMRALTGDMQPFYDYRQKLY